MALRRASKTLKSTSLGTVLNAETTWAFGTLFASSSAPEEVWVMTRSVSSSFIGSEQLTITLPDRSLDLSAHNCINLRLPTHDSFLVWEFGREGHVQRAHVQGQWVFNMGSHILRATLAGCGLAYLPEDMAEQHVASGRLVPMLREWCQPFPGYHLYYPSRRQASPAFRLLVEALRFQA